MVTEKSDLAQALQNEQPKKTQNLAPRATICCFPMKTCMARFKYPKLHRNIKVAQSLIDFDKKVENYS
jgi:hypothetical protein